MGGFPARTKLIWRFCGRFLREIFAGDFLSKPAFTGREATMPAGPDNDDFHFSILGSRRRRRPSCARDERLASRHVISHAHYPRACDRECQRSPRWRTRHHDRRCRITLGGSGSSKMTWVPPSWTGATTREAGAGIRYSRAPLARIPRACMRIMLTGSDGDADTVVRPSARPRVPTEFPPRMPRMVPTRGQPRMPRRSPLGDG